MAKKNELQRIASELGLPVPTKEDHQRAVEAMQPYLAAFQQAANEQFRADFRTEEEMAQCVLTLPDGMTISLQVTDVNYHSQGKILLTFVGKPRIEKIVK